MGCEGLTHHRDTGNIRNCLLPQDDFPTQLPHSAAPLGRHQTSGDVSQGSPQGRICMLGRGCKAMETVSSEAPLQEGIMPKYLPVPLIREIRSERPCRGAGVAPCSVPAKLSIKGLSSLIKMWEESSVPLHLENCRLQFLAAKGSPGSGGYWCPSWDRQDSLQGVCARVQAEHSAAAGCAQFLCSEWTNLLNPKHFCFFFQMGWFEGIHASHSIN